MKVRMISAGMISCIFWHSSRDQWANILWANFLKCKKSSSSLSLMSFFLPFCILTSETSEKVRGISKSGVDDALSSRMRHISWMMWRIWLPNISVPLFCQNHQINYNQSHISLWWSFHCQLRKGFITLSYRYSLNLNQILFNCTCALYI